MDTPPFSELGLKPELLQAVETQGYERPSAIQARAIPLILGGGDIVGLSQTGSGKTAAFGLPILQGLDLRKRAVQALVVCPTRELAVQVCEQMHELGAHLRGLSVIPVYGGAPIERQFRQLQKGAHVVVGTPGRILDHLRRGTFEPGEVQVAVLDEADRMLDLGFREDMEELLAGLPPERQTLFFSATMSREVERLIQRFGREPEVIRIEHQTVTVSTIDQEYYECRQRSKVEVLSRLLDIDPPRLAIVFCNTKRAVDDCTEALLARGYTADRLHGDISQIQRERVLARFREGAIDLLVATDVAARGIDIAEIDVVFNYDLPQDPEDYVHRIGRTGRAGRSGKAVSFVFGKDIYRLQAIERYISSRVTRARIPSQERVEGRRADMLFDLLRDRLEEGEFDNYQEYLDRLLEQGYAATDVLSAMFSLLREAYGREGEAIAEDRYPDGPPREKGGRRGERKESHAAWDNAGFVQLFISLGKKAGIRPGDIVGMMYGETGLPQGSIGKITLKTSYSLVDVREEFAEQVVNALASTKLKGKAVKVKFAQPSRD